MYKYVLFPTPRFNKYIIFALILLVAVAVALRFLLHDYLMATPEAATAVDTTDAAYVATYELPDGSQHTLLYEHTPEEVVANAAEAPEEVVGENGEVTIETPQVDVEPLGEDFERTLNEHLALVDRLSVKIQKDLPLMMLNVQQQALAGDIAGAIAGVPAIQAEVANTRTINNQLIAKTNVLPTLYEADQLSVEESSTISTYVERSQSYTYIINQTLDLYDIVYADARLDPIQPPTQAEVAQAEALAAAGSDAFAAYAVALEAILEL